MKRFLATLAALLLLAVNVAHVMPAHAAATNLIANPSLETSASSKPTGWLSSAWGTNTTTFSYLSTGHTGTHSVQTKMTKYTNGDAKWYFTPVAVTPNTSYTFSDWYESSTASSVDVVVTGTNGTDSYLWQGDPAVSSTWKQNTYTFTTPANAAKVTVYHSIESVGQLTLDDASLTSNSTTTPPTAPTVSVTAPAANATVSGTVNVTATAADAVGVANVQFKLDGNNLGTAVTASPYATSWNTTTATNGTHILTAVATNTSNLSTTSTNVTVTVNNTVVIPPTAPTVSLTAPAANATVSGSVNLTATASDTKGISNVQFKVDGNNIGAAVTSSPYSASWDSTTVANGTHTLTAVATNTSNLSTTSTGVKVTVNNTTTPPAGGANLIANPSVETAASGVPTGWTGDGWGTNTASFSYATTGHTGTHSVKTTITAYTSGDDKWMFTPVAVTSGQTYEYTNYYESNVDTEVDAMVTMSDGTTQYYYVGAALASPTAWTKFSNVFVMPTGAVNATFFQVITKVGWVQADDFSLGVYTPQKFNRPIVSINFDDGWRNIYTNGLPVMKKYGFVTTQFLNSTPVLDGYPDYYTAQMIKDWAAQGSELAWHTQDHLDLTTLTTAKVDKQLTIPPAFLTATGTTTATYQDFATPFGAYNSSVINEIKKYYKSHRSTDVGYNSKDNFDPYNIKVQNIVSTTTAADVQGWVNEAVSTGTWLVIVYHEVSTTPEDTTYYVTPANLDAEMNVIKQSGVAVETQRQAINEITPQL